jgi:hypothetical protein
LRFTWGQCGGGGHEPLGFLPGIQGTDAAHGPGGDEPVGDGVGRGRVEAVDVAGERAHGRESLGKPGLGGPGQGCAIERSAVMSDLA